LDSIQQADLRNNTQLNVVTTNNVFQKKRHSPHILIITEGCVGCTKTELEELRMLEKKRNMGMDATGSSPSIENFKFELCNYW
jgi:hypothetical protein